MFRPSMYDKSQQTLELCANLFNELECFNNIIWEYNKEETFDNDGYFIDTTTNKKIGFDWEIRDKYFEHGEFPFNTLSVFERKVKKDSVGITIQADKEMSAFIVAWQEDFRKANKQTIQASTDKEKTETSTRYTDQFEIFKIKEMIKFKAMIAKAFELDMYNHKIFEQYIIERWNRKNN